MTLIEAAEKALEALETKSFDLHSEWGGPFNGEDKFRELQTKASADLRAAIEAAKKQEQQKPSITTMTFKDCRLKDHGPIPDGTAIVSMNHPPAQPAQQEPVACNHKFVQDDEAPSHACCQFCGEVRTAAAEPAPVQEPVLQEIEQYRLQMAGISTAAIGYWKEGDGIHPDYDTPALRDVAKLYAKYDALYTAAQPAPVQEPVAAMQADLAWAVGELEELDDATVQVVLVVLKKHLCTPPPAAQRQWLGLTDKEILSDDTLRYYYGMNGGAGPVSQKGKRVVAAIEAKLKEKNT